MIELNDSPRKRMSYTWNYRVRKADDTYLNIVQNTTPIPFDHTKKRIICLAHYSILDGNVKLI